MKTLSVREALRDTMTAEMIRDDSVILIGEDIGQYGGAFGITRGMAESFEPERIIETPISENGFVGLGVGAAMLGMRPIVEIMFGDFLTLACDQIINHASKIHYMYDGQLSVPLVIRAPVGAGRGYGPTHSQNIEPIFMNTPGLIIVAPSNAANAKGLLISSIRNNSPVLFLENKLLYDSKCDVPSEDYTIPIGKANVVVEGNDVTIVTYSRYVNECLDLIPSLGEQGISVELIDLQTIKPLDKECIIASVAKTGRILTVEECHITAGVGSEILAIVSENCLEYLKGPAVRVASEDTPFPSAIDLEAAVIPNREKIINGIMKTLSW